MSDRASECFEARGRLLLVLALAAALVALALALGACGDGDGVRAGGRLRPVARLGPPPGEDGAPFAVLARDRRGVLFSYPIVDVGVDVLAWDRERGTARVRATLGPELAASQRIQLKPQVVGDGRARALPPVAADVELRESDPAVIEIDLASELLKGPSDLQLRLRARAIPDEPVIAYTTDEIALPPRASLELAFGFLPQNAAWTGVAAPTRFTASVCRGDVCERVFDETTRSELGAGGWRDRTVALDAFAGERVALRFEVSRTAAAGAGPDAVDFPIWSVPTVYAADERGASKPSLLLVSIDTLRADHLGTYGYARDTSPFIDRELASRGTVFERAFSTATATAESHMSMFTGLSPTAHGVYGSTFSRALPEGIPTLAETLYDAGFETGAVTENGAIGAYRGFARGFATYSENKLRQREGASGQIEETLRQSLAWLARHADKRFFLFVHTYEVHAPYAPPDAFRTYFADDGLDPVRAADLPETWHPTSYDREIRYADEELARFFAELDARGLLDDTIVVLVSDHGEEFAEHGAIGHGPAVHDEVLHVPLIVRGPGIASGRRVEQAVSLVDLMATLLDWAGVDAPARPGATFAARARAVAAAQEPRPVYSESRAATELFVAGTPRAGGAVIRRRRMPVPNYAVRLRDRKLIRTLDPRDADADAPPSTAVHAYRYYDLSSDPDEQHDLWDALRADAAPLRALLERHIADAESERSLRRDAIRSETGTPDVLDAERREKLRALGYLE